MATVTAKTFGEVLKDLRERRGLTGDQLGVKAGLSQGLISKYENGTRQGTRPSAIKIAKALATFDDGINDESYYSFVNALLQTLPNEPPEVRPGQKLTYITDPDAALVAAAYEGLPSSLKVFVKGQVFSAVELAEQLDREETTGATRSDQNDNPTREPSLYVQPPRD